MVNRRDVYRYGSLFLGSAMGVALAIPGVAYLLDPILRRRAQAGAFHPLARLSELTEGDPKAFPVIEARQDAWVKYPPEPVGSVWLIRQKEGASPPVVAFSAECPHLGCAVGLAADGKSFLCPCHTSAFNFEGERLNNVPPRGMDKLEVRMTASADPEVSVKFQRFRTMSKERIPIG